MQKGYRLHKFEIQCVDLQKAAAELQDELKAKHYQVFKRMEAENWAISVRKGVWGHLGSPMLHGALIVIIIGSMVSGIFSKSSSYQVPVPGKIELTNEGYPFDLSVESFQIEYHPDGSPSQYQSDIKATVMGQAVKQQTIAVNSPLTYQGVKVYQSSYGWMVEGSIGLRKTVPSK